MADVKERGWSGAGGNTAPREDSGAPVILEDSRCGDPAAAGPHAACVGGKDPGRAALDPLLSLTEVR